MATGNANGKATVNYMGGKTSYITLIDEGTRFKSTTTVTSVVDNTNGGIAFAPINPPLFWSARKLKFKITAPTSIQDVAPDSGDLTITVSTDGTASTPAVNIMPVDYVND